MKTTISDLDIYNTDMSSHWSARSRCVLNIKILLNLTAQSRARELRMEVPQGDQIVAKIDTRL